MAADTVSAFAPLQFGYDECRIKALDADGNVIADVNSYQQNMKRFGMPFDELDSSKERENSQSVRQTQRRGRESDNLKENSNELNSGSVGHDDNTNGDSKKRRNARKRNRSDMSPEELRRLRERERKAQQSRRDRIRAQKV